MTAGESCDRSCDPASLSRQPLMVLEGERARSQLLPKAVHVFAELLNGRQRFIFHETQLANLHRHNHQGEGVGAERREGQSGWHVKT